MPYLVVGQGLAGTLVSYQLLKRGIPHKVLDNNHNTAATKAAAGIINPVTGRRYVKSWMVDELIPKARSIYTELEQLLSVSLIRDADIIRTWSDQIQEDRWNEATSREGYERYIEEAPPGYHYYDGLTRKPFGFGLVKHSMQVDVALLIEAYRRFLISKEMLVTKQFDHEGLSYDAGLSLGEGDVYSKVVFCEGYRVIDNPLFNHLPFQSAKGESFIVRSEVALPTKMLRDKIFITPLSTHQFWTGGGYIWDDLSEKPTEKFREEWSVKLSELLLNGFEILEHRAGVRPGVKGRRPLIGRHQDLESVYLFNGMGTKGTSLAPYWSEIFIDCVERGIDIPEEVNLNRF